MGSFCESRSSGPLRHQDALQFEHGPQREEKTYQIQNQNLLKIPCVYKKNNHKGMNTKKTDKFNRER